MSVCLWILDEHIQAHVKYIYKEKYRLATIIWLEWNNLNICIKTDEERERFLKILKSSFNEEV